MRLQEKYQKQIIPELMEKLKIKNKMAAPKIKKVVVNVGFGKAISGKGSADRNKAEKHISGYLSLITGQKPSVRNAQRSIAAFKLRQGTAVGVKTTLRGERMHQFLEKLIGVVLPRKRDFRGIPLKSVSAQGNLTIGFPEYTPFPEVKTEKEKGIFGLEVTVCTKAGNRQEAIELLRLIGIPLQKD